MADYDPLTFCPAPGYYGAVIVGTTGPHPDPLTDEITTLRAKLKAAEEKLGIIARWPEWPVPAERAQQTLATIRSKP